MAAEPTIREKNAPYAPVTTFIQLLQRIRSRNVPDRIDISYLDASGIPQSLVTRAAFALRFLGLAQDDAPTAELRELANSTDEEYQAILDRLLRAAYADVFDVVDPASDPPDRIANVFKRYSPASQRERMTNFFLGMCREAGMQVVEGPRSGAGAGSRSPKPGQARAASAKRPKAPPAKSAAESGEVRSGGLPPALELLVRSLPPEGGHLSAARRQQWLEMAKATLSFVYPEEPTIDVADPDEEGEMEQ